MASMLTKSALDLTRDRVLRNLPTSRLVEHALARGEGVLGNNGTLIVKTGDRTGRSPKDKYLEDTPDIHDNIWWGKVNQPITSEGFDVLEEIALQYLSTLETVYAFDGYVGADPKYRLRSRTFTELAWHSLFVKTLFIEPEASDLDGFSPDWTIINCGCRKLTEEEAARAGVAPTGICVAQSLTRKVVLIFGTEYAGEMKKSLFYAMNYDMP
ncbi:MAG: phosphoenolpyruvate carboxykinase (ATP), partial [Phycisphaerales bacterium]|nr:phosphoenolpyruvate carboxykinase (ATP) [Phycisphaerales bacterium]